MEKDNLLIFNEDENILIEAFLSNLKTKKARSNYYRDILKFKAFSNTPLLLISHHECSRYFDMLQANNVPITTRETIYSQLRSFYSYLKRSERIAINPFNTVKKPVAPRIVPDEKTMTYAEINKFIHSALTFPKRDKAIILTLVTTAIKLSEIVSLNWCDLFIDKKGRKVLTVKNHNKVRTYVKVLDDLWKILIEYRVSKGMSDDPGTFDDAPIFTNESGERISAAWVQKIVKMNCAKAGLEKIYPPTVLRHSFANFALAFGASEESIKNQLGLCDKSQVKRYAYTNVTIEEIDDAALDYIHFDFDGMHIKK